MLHIYLYFQEVNKLILEDYSCLPDYMTTGELEKYFKELINWAETVDRVNDVKISEALYELSDRQWHTYEVLSDSLKVQIENWINKVWNTKSLELIENITSIIGNLGLVQSYELVKRSIDEDISSEIKQVLEATIKEINGHIGDPYFSMKKS